MLSLPPMRMLSHPLRSGFLFPLSRLPPLPRCPPPPCLLHSPSSLLVWLPCSVWLCCSSPCPLALLGAPCAHPLLSHLPAPPHEDFTSPHNVDCSACGGLVRALLPPPWRAPPGARGAAPTLAEFVGTSWREGEVWLLMVRSASAAFGGCCGARTSALLHMSPNLQTDLSLVFVGVVLW